MDDAQYLEWFEKLSGNSFQTVAIPQISRNIVTVEAMEFLPGPKRIIELFQQEVNGDP